LHDVSVPTEATLYPERGKDPRPILCLC
jgi:hypothetical protein